MDSSDVILFSIVSIWEIAIKTALRRPTFAVEPTLIAEAEARQGFDMVGVEIEAVYQVGRLPPHHRDPFDRLLIAQATILDAAFLTSDRALAVYGAPVEVV
jgi:PIN domain nuclease of toxin-antitoxin system